MDHKELAAMCKAMGDPTRARIVLFLLGCCCPVAVGETGEVMPFRGVTAGEVCCHLTGEETVTSTVSFHLKELREAGLITMERHGKYMVCGINRDALARLAAFFTDATTRSECC